VLPEAADGREEEVRQGWSQSRIVVPEIQLAAGGPGTINLDLDHSWANSLKTALLLFPLPTS
jgi:hypothetical protein